MSDDQTKRASDDAVQAATGKQWTEWFEVLDKVGASKLNHSRIAGYLRSEHDVKPWWSQMVANGYEKERGLRAEGQTTANDFQVDVRRTFKLSVGRTWELVTTEPGLSAWLGRAEDFRFEKGYQYQTEEGVGGEVRVVSPGNQIRLSWRPMGWAKHTTLRIRFLATGERTVVGFSHEGLPDSEARELAKQRWTQALNDLEELI